jgi:ABC transporter, ATP-binding protein
MKKENKGLLSNCAFLLKFAYKTNKSIFFSKIPQIILNIISPFIPIVFVRLILNEITIGKNIKFLLLFVVLFASSTYVVNLLGSVLNYFVQNQTEITVRKIKNHLGEIVMNMPYSDVERPQVRDFIMRAQDGTNFLQVIEQLSGIITSFMTIAGLAAIIITIQPIIFVFIALVVFFKLIADKKSLRLQDKWRPIHIPVLRKLHYYFRLMQSIEFGKEVRVNNLQDWICERYDKNCEVYLKNGTRHNIEIQRNNILSSIANILQESAVYLILAYKVVFQGMSIGDFSMYTTSVSTFSNSVLSIVGAISNFMQTGLFVRDFRYCIEIADKSKRSHGNKLSDIDTGNIVLQFNNVSFKYPNTDRYILKNISLTLKNNESLSIVGVNGAGKTTLIKLLCRFYEPTEGEILLNGVNIQSFSYDEYINLIGAVFQDFKLFNFTVKENISFDEESDNTRILSCLQRSGLGEKIDELSKGIDTNISKEFDSNGIEFSGGEGQKLAMARTLYKNAPVIILDEPTSALDPIAEAEIYSKFHDITRDKMAIYISHRLSSCRFCDKIAVLDNGEIVQYGNHKELMEADGLYSTMWNMQAQYYVEV